MSAAPPGGVPRALPWVTATVVRAEPRTARIRSIFLDAPLPAHASGQHVDVRLTAQDGHQARRAYSIASVPGASALELLVEVLPGGEVSPWFHAVAMAGDQLEVKGPLGGMFVWRPSDGGPLLLAGGGSGIAPLLSIVRDRSERAPGLPTLLLYSVRRFEDVVWPDELSACQRADPALRVVIATTRGPAGRPGDHEGRFDAASIAAQLEHWGHAPAHVFVCGSTGFVEAMTGGMMRAGVAARDIRAERFGGAAA